jgi:hypothetical protein
MSWLSHADGSVYATQAERTAIGRLSAIPGVSRCPRVATNRAECPLRVIASFWASANDFLPVHPDERTSSDRPC